MKRWVAALPVAGLALLGALAASQLIQTDKAGFSDAALRPAPTLFFTSLQGDGQISFSPPPAGRPIAVNLFASWCAPCKVEHPLLVDLADRYPDQIYGLAYRDAPEDTRSFLNAMGDPFTGVAVDFDGQGGLEFGLTGVPETFVIDASGMIVHHTRGALEPDDIETISALLDTGSRL